MGRWEDGRRQARGEGTELQQFSFNQFQIRSSPSKPLKIHQTWEYGFPQKGPENSLYRMLCTTPRAPSRESMFHPGFGSQI